MQTERYYTPDIAAQAVTELTRALHHGAADDAYAMALLADPRMSSNSGHLASCGVNMRKVKQAKNLLEVGMPTLEAQRRARRFLDGLDLAQKQAVGNGG